MLKNVKEKNEQIIREHFEEVFGENYTFSVVWGFPISLVEITFKKDNSTTIWKIAFNMDEETFELSTFATKTIEDKEIADWATIDKRTIDFIIKRTAEISEQLFVTKEIPSSPGSVEDIPEEVSDTTPIETE